MPALVFAPPAGSDFYYAVLYAPPDVKRRLNVLETFRAEVCHIPFSCSSPGIARVKLDWWRQEIERVYAHAPRHALGQMLAAELVLTASLRQALDDLLTNLDFVLAGGGFANGEARRHAFDLAYGPFWTEFARCCGVDDPSTLRIARDLGVSIEIAYALRDTRAYAAIGLNMLCEPRHDIAQISAAIDTAIARIPVPQRAALRPLRSLGRIVRTTCSEIERDGCRVREQRIELTPLRKLMLAWRTRYLG